MTKIRSRDSSMIQDRRGSGGGGSRGGGGGGGLGDVLGGALGGRGGGGGGLGDVLGGALGGRGGGALGGRSRGGGGKMGGGILMMLLALAATFLLPKLLGGGGSSLGLGGQAAAPSEASTGGDSDTCSSELEQILCGATIDVQQFWIDQYPKSFDNLEYPVTSTVFFSGFTNTGCGQASAQTGPFYCPADKLVYFDLDFLTELQDRFGAQGDLAAQYIVAHEYGHHIQDALGINARMSRLQQSDKRNANLYSIALELQADCLAGVWAADVNDRGLFDTPAEVEEAVNAAAAVGDDRIQQATQGRVDKEAWTHGSSEQRVKWFRVGFDSSDPNTCDTFSDPRNI